MIYLQYAILYTVTIALSTQSSGVVAHNYYTHERVIELREQARAMFQHAYDGYLRHASGYDELRPLTCDGVDTWGSYSLSLIDSLDTLVAMGNFTEFRRAVAVIAKINFDKDINVSVFETNIRIVGGLISAHLLSKRAGIDVEPGWPCQGPLLRLAEDIAQRLLPAFDTKTGMPYGTVNLRYGVPKGETSVTCTAGVGTFLVEFGALSRLTGNPIYEEVALNAVHALWDRRSPIGLFGNHIDVQTGRWTALDSGIGAGVDSFFEYLVKGAILLNRPELMDMFHTARYAIDKYLKRKDWYVWVNMYKGQVTLPVFQSLEAFWPGLLSLFGDTRSALRTISEYSGIWRKYGFLPEFYNTITEEAPANRESYPLRPELIESAMYLFRSTKNQFLLEIGDMMIQSIEYSAKTKCGYATIRNVVTHEKQNRMESFFLSETTKYLYLLFDEHNFMHGDGSAGEILETPMGRCAIHSGPYIFNTEAHPIDLSALHCCNEIGEEIFVKPDLGAYNADALFSAEWRQRMAEQERSMNIKYQCAYEPIDKRETSTRRSESNVSVDIEVLDENEKPAGEMLAELFNKIKQEHLNRSMANEERKPATNHLTQQHFDSLIVKRRDQFKTANDVLNYLLDFMQNVTLDATHISKSKVFEKNDKVAMQHATFEERPYTLWELYKLRHLYGANERLLHRLKMLHFEGDNYEEIARALTVLNSTEEYMDADDLHRNLAEQILLTNDEFKLAMLNTTLMQEFLQTMVQSTNSSTPNVETLRPLLSGAEISSLNVPDEINTSPKVVFENVRELLQMRMRMIETFERLKKLMEESNDRPNKAPAANDKSDQTRVPETVPVPATAPAPAPAPEDKSHKTNTDQSMETMSSTTDRGEVENASDTKAEPSKEKDSVWSQLVQTILRKTTSQPQKFDKHILLRRTRESLSRYSSNKPLRYELLSCMQPAFVERFAYRDFYP